MLRGVLEARWIPDRRIVNTCSAMGALVGFLSLGAPQIWVWLFPIGMAVAIRLIVRWGWLSPSIAADAPRRGLGLLCLAPIIPLLVVFPFTYIWLVLFGILISLVLEIATGFMHSGSAIPTSRRLQDLSVVLSGILILLFAILLYCRVQCVALKRLSGTWHRGLHWLLVTWISALCIADGFLVDRIHWTSSGGFPLEPFWAVLVGFLLTTFILSQAGRVFGHWLTQSSS